MNIAARFATPLVRWIALLCAAYLQGGLNKATDFNGAIAEMNHFGLAPAGPFAIATIVLEVGASVLILAGFYPLAKLSDAKLVGSTTCQCTTRIWRTLFHRVSRASRLRSNMRTRYSSLPRSTIALFRPSSKMQSIGVPALRAELVGRKTRCDYGTSPGAIASAIAQQHLRQILGDLGALVMGGEAYIAYKPGLFDCQ